MKPWKKRKIKSNTPSYVAKPHTEGYFYVRKGENMRGRVKRCSEGLKCARKGKNVRGRPKNWYGMVKTWYGRQKVSTEGLKKCAEGIFLITPSFNFLKLKELN